MNISDAIALSGAKLSPSTQKKLDDWRAGKRVAKKGTQKYVVHLRNRPDLKAS